MRRLLFGLLGQIFKVLSFLYNTFILVQLSCIGYAESFRIKRALLHLINQNKQIRINDRKLDPEPEEHTFALPTLSDSHHPEGDISDSTSLQVESDLEERKCASERKQR